MGNFVLQCMLLLVAVHGLFQCSGIIMTLIAIVTS